MIVCLCHKVSDRDIDLAVRQGTHCFDLLQDDTGVASACGRCHDCARETFGESCRRHGVATGGTGHEQVVRLAG
ncbi:MAG: hypothetical protein RLY78_1594 [Pseudomonadota bacterium]|jgi:bacterioferritin-associated ferredoxin|uniref:Bacterioferritin-associated ferredoxin n=1 Tax=Pseudaquabacterium rugosum TaxID=2984194 RepID=A0ABU9BGA0_9BURK